VAWSARILAALAFASACLFFSVTHLEFPRVGFEGMMVVGSLLAWANLLLCASCLVVALVMYFRRRDKRGGWPSILALSSVVIIFASWAIV